MAFIDALNRRSAILAGLGFLLGVICLSFRVGPELRVAVGGARGPLMVSSLGPSEAAADLPPEEAVDDRRAFYFRKVESRESSVSIPVVASGPFGVALRMDSTVRTRVSVSQDGRSIGDAYVTSGPWSRTAIVETGLGGPADFSLTFEDAPLVGRSDAFRRYIDEVTLRSPEGFRLAWASRVAGGSMVLFLVLLAFMGAGHPLAAAVGLLTPCLLFVLSRYEPAGTALALPRLGLTAVITAALIGALSRPLKIPAKQSALVSLVGAWMVLAYGFLSFLPNHSPGDLDIHIWRTLDLKEVAPTYDGWRLYGSHYPTPSQIRGPATDALGGGPPIPYSPIPYMVFYAAHAMGLDLHWSMNAIEAASLGLLLPFVFAFARLASNQGGAILATLLMALDLPTTHHLGRAHAPAVVGGALGIGGLLAFGLLLPRIQERGMVWKAGGFLGIGALGYSSTPLFYALFGLALLALLAIDHTSRSALVPALRALIVGGVVALALFYGHFVAGLLQGGSAAMTPDMFPGRTFFIFHNESRQSLRLWTLGLYIPLLAALAAAVPLLKRVDPRIRAFLVAWVAAFAGIMALKEPFALPRLLRWAKEDFYVAPAAALIVACAIARIESKRWRYSLMVTSLVVAFLLRARDYGFHADTLRFLR